MSGLACDGDRGPGLGENGHKDFHSDTEINADGDRKYSECPGTSVRVFARTKVAPAI